jgi:hypothetical protein
MQAEVEAVLERAQGLEERLRLSIAAKLEYFAPNRGVLRALLRNGADPQHPPVSLQRGDESDSRR